MVRFTNAARKHRVSRARIRYVLANYTMRFTEAPAAGKEERIVLLGPDATGALLEVIVVADNGDLIVIHAMPIGTRNRRRYEEAQPWKT